MGIGSTLWECRNLGNLPLKSDWRFQIGSPDLNERILFQKNNSHFREEERHGYRRENCPAGFTWIGAPSPAAFSKYDTIDNKKPSVCWRFPFDDPCFQSRAFCVPPGFHSMEEEFHEFHKIEGDYNQKCRNDKPCPVLPPPECTCTDPEDCCTPPPRPQPICISNPPPPVEPQCVEYENKLGEREWHTINVVYCQEGKINDEREVSQYERKFKTCNPCDLPPVNCDRSFSLPGSKMRPNLVDSYCPGNPPIPGELPPIFDYKEDIGESNKRETSGPGPYCGPGYTMREPVCNTDCIPYGFYYLEQETQCYSKKEGGFEGKPIPINPYSGNLPCSPRGIPPCPYAPPCGPNPYFSSCYRPDMNCPPYCPGTCRFPC